MTNFVKNDITHVINKITLLVYHKIKPKDCQICCFLRLFLWGPGGPLIIKDYILV